ncbi:DUF2798 domain-containing protein [Marinobacter sp. NP-4(2019)]|uniref:DUF2798 domain-containing protein n=1 Tax=Marinobacter sp. NP-4(2019) TaxID=2488665 RepID=UPI000FC3C8E4|nr:DUF2798 domain-containing protein [Marinobacter sp. NP-4(2019)]AZT84784.1 DUF2798 domain-containing protein [Marinobacter sp. NP-4(2019)]
MVPVKYAPYVFSFFMSLLMSGIMSFVISVFNVGLVDDIVIIWLKAWMFAFAVALPTIIAVTPLVRKLVALTVVQGEEH